MSSAEDQDRASIMTYIPQYQKDVWVEHAAALGMSQSEFVRTMVQAGRRDFPVDTLTPDLQRRVISMITEAGVLDWEALLAEVRGDIESELEEALAALQEANRIRYDGRQGGYVRTGDE
jgi:antitoxin component of RelBE/YafQ-DinJ toxin-antitoxin module